MAGNPKVNCLVSRNFYLFKVIPRGLAMCPAVGCGEVANKRTGKGGGQADVAGVELTGDLGSPHWRCCCSSLGQGTFPFVASVKWEEKVLADKSIIGIVS